MTIREITNAIEAKMIFGNLDEKINRVVMRSGNIREHTLFFHLEKKDINKEIITGMNNYVVVTNDKSMLEKMDGKGHTTFSQ